MKISVVLAAYNRKKLLDNTISAFLLQDYVDKEIIIVDNASSDGTKEMVLSKYPADKYPELKYIYLPANIDIRAVNIAIAISTGEIIWRSDDDAYLRDTDSLTKIAHIMTNNPEIGIICAALINRDVENNKDYFVKWYPSEIDYENVPDNGYKAHVFSGAGAALRKEMLNKIGYFWKFGYEEIEISTRAIVAGYQVRYFPNIAILHFGAYFNGVYEYWYWDKSTLQLLRYQAKYFPLRKALIRTSIIIFYQFLFTMKYKFTFKQTLVGTKNMFKSVFNTLQNERDSVPKELVKDITLGESLSKGYNDRLFGFLKKRFLNGYK
ncbi:MAG: glycosyltransferase family 2 protein [bacterium]